MRTRVLWGEWARTRGTIDFTTISRRGEAQNPEAVISLIMGDDDAATPSATGRSSNTKLFLGGAVVLLLNFIFNEFTDDSVRALVASQQLEISAADIPNFFPWTRRASMWYPSPHASRPRPMRPCAQYSEQTWSTTV